MSQTTIEFLEKLRHFVESEANTQYKQLERQWSAPLADRVAKGWAIEGVRVEDFRNNILHLPVTRTNPASGKATWSSCTAATRAMRSSLCTATCSTMGKRTWKPA